MIVRFDDAGPKGREATLRASGHKLIFAHHQSTY
jgi:hypothetical protein